MKLLAISLAIIVTGCTTTPTASQSESVQVVTELKTKCKFIRMQKCESRRKKHGDKECYRRLGKMAMKAGADTVLIDELFEYSQMILLDNNAFGDEKIIVESRFYQCDIKPKQ